MRNQLGSVVIALVLGCLPVQMIFCEVGWAQTERDRKVEAYKLNELGIQLLNKGQLKDALVKFGQVLDIYIEIKDRSSEGTALNNIGGIYEDLGQYVKALEYYQRALAIKKQVGKRSEEGTIINNIGVVYKKLGQYVIGLWTNLKQKMDERAIRGEKISDMRNRSTDDLGVRK